MTNYEFERIRNYERSIERTNYLITLNENRVERYKDKLCDIQVDMETFVAEIEA